MVFKQVFIEFTYYSHTMDFQDRGSGLDLRQSLELNSFLDSFVTLDLVKRFPSKSVDIYFTIKYLEIICFK